MHTPQDVCITRPRHHYPQDKPHSRLPPSGGQVTGARFRAQSGTAGREGWPCQQPVPTASSGGTLFGLLPGEGNSNSLKLPTLWPGFWRLEPGKLRTWHLMSQDLCSEGEWSDLQVDFPSRSDCYLSNLTNTCSSKEVPRAHAQPGFPL